MRATSPLDVRRKEEERVRGSLNDTPRSSTFSSSFKLIRRVLVNPTGSGVGGRAEENSQRELFQLRITMDIQFILLYDTRNEEKIVCIIRSK